MEVTLTKQHLFSLCRVMQSYPAHSLPFCARLLHQSLWCVGDLDLKVATFTRTSSLFAAACSKRLRAPPAQVTQHPEVFVTWGSTFPDKIKFRKLVGVWPLRLKLRRRLLPRQPQLRVWLLLQGALKWQQCL